MTLLSLMGPIRTQTHLTFGRNIGLYVDWRQIKYNSEQVVFK